MKNMQALQERLEMAFVGRDMAEFAEKVKQAMKGGHEDHTGVTVALVMRVTKHVIDNFETYYPKQSQKAHKAIANLIGAELLGNIVGYQLVKSAVSNQARYQAIKEMAELIGDVAIELTLKEHEEAEIRNAAKAIKVRYGAAYIKKALKRLQEKSGIEVEDQKTMNQFAQNLMFKAMLHTGLFEFGECMDDEGVDILSSITFNKTALDAIGIRKEQLAAQSVQFRPLVIKARDWTSVRDGGYLTNGMQFPLVNARGSRVEIAEYEDRLNNSESFKRFMNAVNIAQRTAYKVNTDAYKLMRKVFLSGEAMMDIPSYKTVERDEKRICRLYGQLLRAARSGKSQDELNKLHRAMQMVKVEAYKKEVARKSKREASERILYTAAKFRMFKEIYFAYQADFRGRIYNTCPTLSTQGSDLSKGLLLFKNGKQLGKNGYFWLCIHAANVYGGDESLDKKPFADRVKFIQDNPELIRIIANGDISDPKFVEAIKKAENPVMFYAVCRELVQLIDMSDSEREAFVSYIPIGMDGSCNGQQWAAGFLRSRKLAENVNLVKSSIEDTPNDLYRSVANGMVKFLMNPVSDIIYSIESEIAKPKKQKKGKKNAKK